jgi:lactoylglutathione lyase
MRILHTMLRVVNLEKSIQFYTEILGMQLLSKHDFPEGKFTLAFLGFGDTSEQATLELTHNWDVTQYEHGNAFGHLAIGVHDVYQFCEVVRQKGGKIKREAGPMKGGTTVIAFVEDPDGYAIEILAR